MSWSLTEKNPGPFPLNSRPGSLRLKIFGGQTKKILFRYSGARVDHLKDHPRMPSASAQGLTAQDVRNIAGHLRTP